MNSEDLKLVVQQHYGEIAVASNKEQSCWRTRLLLFTN